MENKEYTTLLYKYSDYHSGFPSTEFGDILEQNTQYSVDQYPFVISIEVSHSFRATSSSSPILVQGLINLQLS